MYYIRETKMSILARIRNLREVFKINDSLTTMLTDIKNRHADIEFEANHVFTRKVLFEKYEPHKVAVRIGTVI